MNIMLTGGAGFIGFHTAKALLERGNSVICIDNFNDYYSPQIKVDRSNILESYNQQDKNQNSKNKSNKNKFNADKINLNNNYQLYKIDITDYESLKIVCRENKIDKICHLAAQPGVLYSLKNPFIYEKTNILGTLNIFQLAREFKIPEIVFASSSSVYGGNDKFPSSESDSVDQPSSLYAATKRSTELIAHAYHYLYGIKMIGLRFFNVYGEFGRPDMMPWKFTENILAEKEIILNNHGNTWKDYTYIADIVSGILKALDSGLDFEIINLGNHNPVHLKHCLEIIETELGKKAIVNNQPLPPGDIIKSYADISKAKKLLGWEPTTKIEEGLVRFVRWYKRYKHL